MRTTLFQKNNPYSHWEYLDCESGDRLRIVPERGGLITEWLCNGKEILYFDLDRFQSKGQSIRGGIPILFPICGDLPQGLLSLPQGDFSINQHGFARDIAWDIQHEIDNNDCSLSLMANEKTREVYPFDFSLEMKVKLQETSLSIRIIVVNRSHQIMPFGLGLHPYFNVTDLQNIRIKGLSDTCFNHLNGASTLTQEQLGRLDKGVDFLAGSGGSVSLFDLASNTSIVMKHSKPMDLAVVWTDPPRKMVCLEPWTSPRQALLTGDRRLVLEPGCSLELNCSFSANS